MVVKDYIDKMLPGEGKLILGDKSWDLSTLIKATEGLNSFDMSLMSIDLERYPWQFKHWSFSTFLFHWKRCEVCSDDPIILSPDGYIIDGWHRLAKAIMEGKDSIKAIRLLVMPEPDEINDNKE